MIIVRNNSLIDIDSLSVCDIDKYDKKYADKETWQHMPQLITNKLASENKNKYPEHIFSMQNHEPRNDRYYIKSMYNISKKYLDGKTVLLNTASEAVVILSEDEEKLFGGLDKTTDCSDFISVMIDFGFLVAEDSDESFEFEIMRNQFAYKPEKVVNITIYPTQACNARCFYCFEQKEQKVWMSEDTADEVVDYITRTLTKDNELVYRWFGGEPLLGEKIIDRIISGVDEYFKGELVYHSIIITNNSLINDELIEKFKDKWHVKKVQTTIDGYREEHDRRKAYVDKSIDRYQQTLDNIRKLLNAGFFTICRFNCDKYNMDQFGMILDDLEEFRDNKRFYIHVTTLRNKSHPEEEAKKRYIYPSDYKEFYQLVLNLLFEKGFYKDVISILPLRARNTCLACSITGLVINSEGKFFRCLQDNLEDSNSTGDCRTGVLHNEAYKKWFVQMNNLPATCSKCKYLPCCQGGCKHYRMENKADASPCLREKFYIDVILDIVHKYVV